MRVSARVSDVRPSWQSSYASTRARPSSRGESFDEQPMADVDSEAIDFRAASESYSEFRKLTERDLDVLGLCTIRQGRRVPTVGGLLLSGRERLVHFPDAWAQ